MALNEKQLKLFESEIDSWRIRKKDMEKRKTYDEVFDESTLLVLYKMQSDGVIGMMEYPIATGKEGNVYKAKSPEKKNLAVKIFRTATATFKHLSGYIVGDKRFRSIRPRSRHIIRAWAQKEFRNLEVMRSARVRVPRAVKCTDNVLVMEYIGDDSMPAPVLRTVGADDPGKVFSDVALNMKRINDSGLVHADLSEYNVLMWRGKPYIIDVGQAVTLEHPMAGEFRQRDVRNVVRYFTSLGVETSEPELMARIRGD